MASYPTTMRKVVPGKPTVAPPPLPPRRPVLPLSGSDAATEAAQRNTGSTEAVKYASTHDLGSRQPADIHLRQDSAPPDLFVSSIRGPTGRSLSSPGRLSKHDLTLDAWMARSRPLLPLVQV